MSGSRRRCRAGGVGKGSREGSVCAGTHLACAGRCGWSLVCSDSGTVCNSLSVKVARLRGEWRTSSTSPARRYGWCWGIRGIRECGDSFLQESYLREEGFDERGRRCWLCGWCCGAIFCKCYSGLWPHISHGLKSAIGLESHQCGARERAEVACGGTCLHVPERNETLLEGAHARTARTKCKCCSGGLCGRGTRWCNCWCGWWCWRSRFGRGLGYGLAVVAAVCALCASFGCVVRFSIAGAGERGCGACGERRERNGEECGNEEDTDGCAHAGMVSRDHVEGVGLRALVCTMWVCGFGGP